VLIVKAIKLVGEKLMVKFFTLRLDVNDLNIIIVRLIYMSVIQ